MFLPSASRNSVVIAAMRMSASSCPMLDAASRASFVYFCESCCIACVIEFTILSEFMETGRCRCCSVEIIDCIAGPILSMIAPDPDEICQMTRTSMRLRHPMAPSSAIATANHFGNLCFILSQCTSGDSPEARSIETRTTERISQTEWARNTIAAPVTMMRSRRQAQSLAMRMLAGIVVGVCWDDI